MYTKLSNIKKNIKLILHWYWHWRKQTWPLFESANSVLMCVQRHRSFNYYRKKKANSILLLTDQAAFCLSISLNPKHEASKTKS